MTNPQESFGQPVVTVSESRNINELVEAVTTGIHLCNEKNVDSADIKKDLAQIKLTREGQVPLSEIEKIKNRTIREKVSGFFIRLGVSVDTLESVPSSHLKKHDKGWVISHIHPDGKTVDLAKTVEIKDKDGVVSFNKLQKENNEKLEKKDNVPISEIAISKEQDSFEKKYPVLDKAEK